jgi:hypothetical protein
MLIILNTIMKNTDLAGCSLPMANLIRNCFVFLFGTQVTVCEMEVFLKNFPEINAVSDL